VWCSIATGESMTSIFESLAFYRVPEDVSLGAALALLTLPGRDLTPEEAKYLCERGQEIIPASYLNDDGTLVFPLWKNPECADEVAIAGENTDDRLSFVQGWYRVSDPFVGSTPKQTIRFWVARIIEK
jgi:hypothetical protein